MQRTTLQRVNVNPSCFPYSHAAGAASTSTTVRAMPRHSNQPFVGGGAGAGDGTPSTPNDVASMHDLNCVAAYCSLTV